MHKLLSQLKFQLAEESLSLTNSFDQSRVIDEVVRW